MTEPQNGLENLLFPLALYKEKKNEKNYVICDDCALDSEGRAVFNPQAFKDIFGTKKSEMSQSKQRGCVVRIANGNRKIFRKFQAHSVDDLKKDCVALSLNAWYELGIAKNDPPTVSVKKSWFFPYFLHHPNSATRISFKLGILALFFAIIGIIVPFII